MKTKLCPKCKRVLPIYKFGVRKQKKWVKSIKKYRVYYHAQSYCYVCRQGITPNSATEKEA